MVDLNDWLRRCDKAIEQYMEHDELDTDNVIELAELLSEIRCWLGPSSELDAIDADAVQAAADGEDVGGLEGVIGHLAGHLTGEEE